MDFVPGDDVTVRRMIIDWGIDLISSTDGGTVNSDAQVTLGLQSYSESAMLPGPPGHGPGTHPEDAWSWWQGAWYTNAYGFSLLGSNPAGVMTCNGRIDKSTPKEMDNTLYTSWYLTAEIDDPHPWWNSWQFVCWAQTLYAHTD